MVDRAGIRAALSETRGYLLSHHGPDEQYRCYAPVVFGRRVRLCARCFGIYPGIALGVLVALLGPTVLGSLAVVAFLPIPALLDWAATTFIDRRGYNVIRTTSGGLLGFAYGVGLVGLLVDGDARILAVGVVYAAVAGGLLVVSHRADG
jgi:uncharacterized membrane protein